MKTYSIYPEFIDIEKGENTRTNELVAIYTTETYCDKFMFIHKIITSIVMGLLIIGLIIIIIVLF